MEANVARSRICGGSVAIIKLRRCTGRYAKLINMSEATAHPSSSYYAGIESAPGDIGSRALEPRWSDVAEAASFRATDHVLDVGCAEGLVAFQIAGSVAHVHAIELDPARAMAAEALRRERSAANVLIEHGDISTTPLAPDSFDVVLYLGVFHNQPVRTRWATLERLTITAKRTLLVRTPIRSPEECPRSARLVNTMTQAGFTVAVTSPRAENVSPLIAGHRPAMFAGALPEATGVMLRARPGQMGAWGAPSEA